MEKTKIILNSLKEIENKPISLKILRQRNPVSHSSKRLQMIRILVIITLMLSTFGDFSFARTNDDKQKERSKATMMYGLELEIFLKNSDDLEMTDKYGFTSLFPVALIGEPESLQKWIKAGADVNAKSNSGNTPLFFAVISNQTENVKVLIEAGVDVNHKKKNGDSVLHYSIQRPYMVSTNTVISLIKYGSDVNSLNAEGKSPLHLLRLRKNDRWGTSEIELEKILISKGAKDIGGFREQEKEEIEKPKTQCDGNSKLPENNGLCLTK